MPITVITKKDNKFQGNLKAALANAPKKAEKAVVKNCAVTFWGNGVYLGKSTTCRPFVPPTKK